MHVLLERDLYVRPLHKRLFCNVSCTYIYNVTVGPRQRNGIHVHATYQIHVESTLNPRCNVGWVCMLLTKLTKQSILYTVHEESNPTKIKVVHRNMILPCKSLVLVKELLNQKKKVVQKSGSVFKCIQHLHLINIRYSQVIFNLSVRLSDKQKLYS